jgi:hypothetical protein
MRQDCPHCHKPTARAAREPGGFYLKGDKFRIFPDRLVYACGHCGGDIEVPVSLPQQRPLPLVRHRPAKVPV